MALIPRYGAILARVAHHQLAAAAAATQEPRQQRRPPLRRPPPPVRAKVRNIVVEHLLDPLELIPANVTLVMIGDQHRPVQRLAHDAAPQRPVDDLGVRAGTAISVGTGIRRLLEKLDHRAVGRPPPPRLVAARAAPLRRQLQSVLDEPCTGPAGRAQLEELPKDQLDRLLHANVRVLLRALIRRLDEAHRTRDDELAAAGLRPPGLERTLAQQVELVLAHRPLQAQKQMVVGAAGVVDRFVIDQQRLDHGAHLDQLMPVAVVARKARHLDRRPRPDLPRADLGDKALKPHAPRSRGGRESLVLVDDLRLPPAQTPHPLLHRVLQAPALQVVHELLVRRLTHVDQSATVQMTSRELLTHSRHPLDCATPTAGCFPEEAEPIDSSPLPGSAPAAWTSSDGRFSPRTASSGRRGVGFGRCRIALLPSWLRAISYR